MFLSLATSSVSLIGQLKGLDSWVVPLGEKEDMRNHAKMAALVIALNSKAVVVYLAEQLDDLELA